MKDKEQTIGKGSLETLLRSAMFSWPNEPERKIDEYIAESARTQAKTKLTYLEKNTETCVKDVLNSVLPRAQSWKLEKLLDHFMLRRPCLLSHSYPIWK